MAHRTSPDPHLVSLTAPGSFAAEQYQGLRLRIERMARARGLRTIAVSSPAAGDGKTTTAINLAGALADDRAARVLLVDGDLRRPAIAGQLALPAAAPGFADALGDGGPALDEVVQRLDAYNLSVVPAGASRPGASQILRSRRLDDLLALARSRHDYVVIDTPPLLAVFDSALLAKWVDGILLVVAANRTPRKLLGEALNLLDPSKVLGIVFNRDDRPMFGYYESYYREYFPAVSGLTGA